MFYKTKNQYQSKLLPNNNIPVNIKCNFNNVLLVQWLLNWPVCLCECADNLFILFLNITTLFLKWFYRLNNRYRRDISNLLTFVKLNWSFFMRLKFAKFASVSMCNKTFYSGGFHQVFIKNNVLIWSKPLKLLQSFSFIDVYESGATFNVLLKKIALSIASNNRQCRGRILVMYDRSMNELWVT